MRSKEHDSHSNVTYLWRDTNGEPLSDDPLGDLLNEFGTEEIEVEETLPTPNISEVEESSIDEELRDHFYENKFSTKEFRNDLEELEYLLAKTQYLTKKIKYYSDFMMRK